MNKASFVQMGCSLDAWSHRILMCAEIFQAFLTHRLLHNYGYKWTVPYRTVVDESAVGQCQPSNLQQPLKERDKKLICPHSLQVVPLLTSLLAVTSRSTTWNHVDLQATGPVSHMHKRTQPCFQSLNRSNILSLHLVLTMSEEENWTSTCLPKC